MALQVGGNYRGELLRARMARTISPADLVFLFPEYPKDAPTTLAEVAPVYRRLALDDLYEALPPIVGPNFASNNWVVDGRHSASGKPILANDPHLAFAAPGVWYLAQLETPQHKIAGATAAVSRWSSSATTNALPGGSRRRPPMSRISLSSGSIPPIPTVIGRRKEASRSSHGTRPSL
jgi:hypothetical protein